jgi:hypothetical protein
MVSVSSSFELHQQQASDIWANQGELEERLGNLSSKLVEVRVEIGAVKLFWYYIIEPLIH